MIRALLPVAFALVLAIAAGILLARNGVLTDNAVGGFSATSSCGSCCSKAPAEEMKSSLASAGTGCCARESSAEVAGCCSPEATLASLASEGEEDCSAGGCPCATASAESKCCSEGSQCCSGDAKSCSADEAGGCCSGEKPCGEDAKACCSDGGECCSEKKEEEGQAEVGDPVAALSE